MVKQMIRMRREHIAAVQVVRMLPVGADVEPFADCQQRTSSCDLGLAHRALERIAGSTTLPALAALSRPDKREERTIRLLVRECCHFAYGGLSGGTGAVAPAKPMS